MLKDDECKFCSRVNDLHKTSKMNKDGSKTFRIEFLKCLLLEGNLQVYGYFFAGPPPPPLSSRYSKLVVSTRAEAFISV